MVKLAGAAASGGGEAEEWVRSGRKPTGGVKLSVTTGGGSSEAAIWAGARRWPKAGRSEVCGVGLLRGPAGKKVDGPAVLSGPRVRGKRAGKKKVSRPR